MKVALASDHAGVSLKIKLTEALSARDVLFHDFGPSTDEPVDYPDYAAHVAESVAARKFDRGILICGTGIGMAIAANKIPGIRAATITRPDEARLCREHNDVNVLTLGARHISVEQALTIVEVFLETPFQGGRHRRRVDKISALEVSVLDDAIDE